MLRLPLWFVGSVAVLMGVLGYLCWQQHRQVVKLRADVEKSSALPRERADENRPDDRDAGAEMATLPKINLKTLFEPRVRTRLLQYQRWTRLGEKADLVATMNLPSDKLAKFKALLLARESAITEARASARQSGIESDSGSATTAALDATQGVDEKIQGLLGEHDFARYVEWVGTDLFRKNPVFTGILHGRFIDAGVPLTTDQMNFMAKAFYRGFVTQSVENRTTGDETDQVAGLTSSQRRVLEQALSVLSAAQVEILRNFFRGDNELGIWMQAAAGSNVGR